MNDTARRDLTAALSLVNIRADVWRVEDGTPEAGQMLIETRLPWQGITWLANTIRDAAPGVDADFQIKGLMNRLDCSVAWQFYLHRAMEPFGHRVIFWMPVEVVDAVIERIEAAQ